MEVLEKPIERKWSEANVKKVISRYKSKKSFREHNYAAYWACQVFYNHLMKKFPKISTRKTTITASLPRFVCYNKIKKMYVLKMYGKTICYKKTAEEIIKVRNETVLKLTINNCLEVQKEFHNDIIEENKAIQRGYNYVFRNKPGIKLIQAEYQQKIRDRKNDNTSESI